MKLEWILLKRFLNRVLITKKDLCWEWQGKTRRDGYAHMNVKGKFILVHRLAWIIHSGQAIPSDREICHHCDNPKCVNPDHLYLGTHQENMQDFADRQAPDRSGSSNGNSFLTEEEVRQMKRELAEGAGRKAMSIKYKIHLSQVDRIINRKAWTHV